MDGRWPPTWVAAGRHSPCVNRTRVIWLMGRRVKNRRNRDEGSENIGAGACVRAGRLRCCRAPPPGPRAGAGRCVGLGLSPAIMYGQSLSRYVPAMWRAVVFLLTGPYRYFRAWSRALVSDVCAATRLCLAKRQHAIAVLVTLRTIAVPARGVSPRSPPAALRRRRLSRSPHRRGSHSLCTLAARPTLVAATSRIPLRRP